MQLRYFIGCTLLLAFSFLPIAGAFAQSYISGSPSQGCPSSVNGSYTFNYTDSDGFLCSEPSWSITGGSVSPGYNAMNATTTWTSTGSVRVDYCVGLYYGGTASRYTTYYFTMLSSPAAGTISASTTAICSGSGVTLSVSGNNGGVTWQKCTSGCGTGNDTGWSTTTSSQSNMTVTTNFRAKLANACGTSYSNVVTVSVNTPVTGGSIGSNQTICYNSDVAAFTNTGNPSGGNNSYTYQWEMRTPGGTWSSISGATGATYDHGNLTATQEFRRVATSCGLSGYSSAVTVTVYSTLNAGAIASAQTICYNSDVAPFTNAASASGGNGSYSYQWQIRSPGGTWSNISGATIATYDHGTLTQTQEFRRSVSSCGETAYTSALTVTVYPALAAGSIAGSQTICYNSDVAAFTSTAGASGGNGSYSYQWQMRSPGGAWSNISGATIATYDHGTLTQTKEFRRQVSSCGQTFETTAVTVTVDPLSVGGTPGPSVEAYGIASGQLTLTGHLGSVQKWEQKIGTGNWTNIINTTTTLSYSNVNATTYYRAQVKNGVCSAVYSNQATITIHAVPSVTIQGESAIPPGGSTTLVTNQGLYSYQWYKNDAVITGATSYNLVVTMPANYKVAVKATSTAPTYTTGNVVIGDAYANQPTPVNYIISTTFLKGGITPQTDLYGLLPQDLRQEVQYFDGLGRPLQTVSVIASPTGKDLVQPIVYDQFGREKTKYLPYGRNRGDGRYVTTALADQATFYSTAVNVEHDSSPLQETVFEDSPLNRVLKQGAPGTAWQPDIVPYETTTDHTVKFKYLVNDATDVLKWTYTAPTTTYPFGQLSAGTSASPVRYAANELFKQKKKDENQNEVITFTDKQDRIVLKKVQATASTWADTYYIYDDYGRLVSVIPPEAVSRLAAEYHDAGASAKQTFLQQWAFRYRYDKRSRMILKQVPGADSLAMVYDNRDRLVMIQNGNQRNAATKEWTFTKYDVLNRPVLTGKYASTNTRVAMQTAVDSYYSVITAGESWYETYQGASGTVLGYTNASFPNVSSEASYYSATYYDIHDTYIAPVGYAYLNESLPGQESTAFDRIKGLPTAAKVKNLSTGAWMRTVNYYDWKQRIIQAVSDHHKGKVRTSNVYDFAKLLISKRTYEVNSVTKAVKETYGYDNGGRLLTVRHSMDGAADVMIVKNEYNELGQLIDKKLHSTDGGTTFKQSVDHRYNIRGWLTKINEAAVSTIASGDPGYDHFGMELTYNSTVNGLTTTQMFNGNISAIQWSKGNGGSVGKQSYTFKYDQMSRLLEASHFDYEAAAWTSNSKSFQEKIHEYDLNGNRKKLSRREYGGMLMDSLSYSYTGNRLNYVHDYGNQVEGFVNTNTGTDDYDYDFNGNMDKDKNKGLITKGNIKYNHLNLPYEIVKGTESIKYIYDASGRKLAQEVYSNNGGTLIKYTDYIGELVYEGNALQFIQHSEGRVLPDGGGWEYQYHLKDHLGNVRVTFTTKPQTPVNYTANLETGTGGSGETTFGNYTSTTFDLVDHTDAGTTYQKVQWLNGGASGRVGLTKSLSVMPGDRVSITAYAKYMNLSGTGNTNPFAAALTAAFGVSSGSTGEQLKLYNGLNDYGLSVTGGDHPLDDETSPKAFVTILLFDRNYNLLDAAWDQVNFADGEQSSGTIKEPPHDQLFKEVTVQEAGYAYIFLSNEHPTYVDVYFDDVTVAHTTSPIVSSADYFPFGLTYYVGEKQGTEEQKYLYNGKELQDELGLDWYDYGARMYMPEIGRWGVLDPLGDKARRWTPYRYGFDNPLRFVDPDGMFEASDGYSMRESRLETGSVSYSGTYQNGASSFGQTTIYIQDLDETKQNEQRNTTAVAQMRKDLQKFSNIKVELVYKGVNKVMSKSDFYNPKVRSGARKRDSYILLGTSEQLVAGDKNAGDSGWDAIGRLHYHDVNGYHSSNDNYAVLNSTNLNKPNGGIGASGYKEHYGTAVNKMSLIAQHEFGHIHLGGHPKADGWGHVRGTIMDEQPDHTSQPIYDDYMVEVLGSD